MVQIFIYYTTRGLKILDYTRRRVIENFPSSSCIRVDYIMNKINKEINKQVPETDWAHSVAEQFNVTVSAKNFVC
jgi:adenosylmethionine-8-amino-7-oxononanoate aminotransferase